MSKYITVISIFLGIMLGLSLPVSSQAKYRFVPITVQDDMKAGLGKPAIVLLVKDLDKNQIKPFMFVLRDTVPFAMYNLNARQYRIISATLQTNYGRIEHFCQIKRGVVTNHSLTLHLNGVMVRNLWNFVCKSRYDRQPC